MQNNADNQNNRENLQRLSFFKFKSIIDSYFYHFATRCMASLKVMIQNNALSVTKFEIFYLDYSATQLHEKVFEKA